MFEQVPVSGENRPISGVAPQKTSSGTHGAEYMAKTRNHLLALWQACGSWRGVSERLGFNRGYLHSVAEGHRPPSRRLLLALGVVKPERRYGIRVRMSYADARQVARGVVPVALRARVAGAVASKECT